MTGIIFDGVDLSELANLPPEKNTATFEFRENYIHVEPIIMFGKRYAIDWDEALINWSTTRRDAYQTVDVLGTRKGYEKIPQCDWTLPSIAAYIATVNALRENYPSSPSARLIDFISDDLTTRTMHTSNAIDTIFEMIITGNHQEKVPNMQNIASSGDFDTVSPLFGIDPSILTECANYLKINKFAWQGSGIQQGASHIMTRYEHNKIIFAPVFARSVPGAARAARWYAL